MSEPAEWPSETEWSSRVTHWTRTLNVTQPHPHPTSPSVTKIQTQVILTNLLPRASEKKVAHPLKSTRKSKIEGSGMGVGILGNLFTTWHLKVFYQPAIYLFWSFGEFFSLYKPGRLRCFCGLLDSFSLCFQNPWTFSHLCSWNVTPFAKEKQNIFSFPFEISL